LPSVFQKNIGSYAAGSETYSAVYNDMKTNGNNSAYYVDTTAEESLALSEVGDFTYWIYEAEVRIDEERSDSKSYL